uniref:BRO1 domain-containing protein n=1 Tax=Pyrodinium bahamense TaxID=73915 RepID=A0A7S0F8Q4_9DINO|mmetsp:Transcript_11947/g.32822  ORF Transcript_11947/g.32822 Transcript_11947/m.32822 type:complete len:366 (+) Transcript_11947:44-1141(+)
MAFRALLLWAIQAVAGQDFDVLLQSAVSAKEGKGVTAAEAHQTGKSYVAQAEEHAAVTEQVASLLGVTSEAVSCLRQQGRPPHIVRANNEALLASLASLRALTGQLALSGNDTSILPDSVRENLKTVYQSISQTLFANLDTMHEEDQAEVRAAYDSMVQCNTEQAKRVSDTGDVETARQAVQASRDNHRDIRNDEAQLYEENETAWAEFSSLRTDTAALPNPEACEPFSRETLTDMSKFFKEEMSIVTWWNRYRPIFLAKEMAYEAANGNLSKYREKADAAQEHFESAYRHWQRLQVDMCGDYNLCWDKAKDNFNATTARVQESETARKTYYQSGQAALCHLQVLLQRNNRTFDECTELVHNTSK